MKVILIGGPFNQKIIDIRYNDKIIELHDLPDNPDTIVTYEKTSGIIEGYQAYKMKSSREINK